ncbi:hypothetical protein ABT024_36665 [Streptomyces sp. NPDC002812]
MVDAVAEGHPGLHGGQLREQHQRRVLHRRRRTLRAFDTEILIRDG